MRARIFIRILQFPAALAIVAAITLIYHKAVHVNATTVALTFLLAILAVSTFWGMAVAITMSVVSMLAWNYYFLPPTGTLTISDPENWVALIAFLAVAMISSKLSTTARQQAADALARRTHDRARLQAADFPAPPARGRRYRTTAPAVGRGRPAVAPAPRRHDRDGIRDHRDRRNGCGCGRAASP